MSHALGILLFALGLFVGMVLLLTAGRRAGLRQRAADPEGAGGGGGVLDGAVFGLLGLLLAFTFSGAAARWETRRQLIVEEANDIGTAYLRLDMLPATAQPALREDFRRYLDARLAAYAALPDIQAAKAGLARATTIQGEIWARAVVACREAAGSQATILLLPALNAMIDITTTRTAATQNHPPSIVYGMLTVLALASALLGGYGMAGGRAANWIHILGFALTMAVTVYVILDLEYPRLGLVRIDAFDRPLVEVREGMK